MTENETFTYETLSTKSPRFVAVERPDLGYLRTLARFAIEVTGHGVCHYCGDPAETRDHLLPKSMRGKWEDCPWVPACQSCNSILGAVFQPDPAERSQIVKDRLASKYAELLDREWPTADEYEELGHFMRRARAGNVVKRHATLNRIAFPHVSAETLTQRARDALSTAITILGQ